MLADYYWVIKPDTENEKRNRVSEEQQREVEKVSQAKRVNTERLCHEGIV
jgi:hypothetical protein